MWSSSFVIATILLVNTGSYYAFINTIQSRIKRIPSNLVVRTTTDRVETEVRTAYGIESWRGGYKTCEKETVEALEGDFPDDLSGTYFRNIFGKFEAGRIPILHPFDADGMIAAVTIKEGKVTFRNSFIRTIGFKKEQITRKMAGRGTFGNHKMPGFLGNFFSLKMKNVANTNIIYWGGRLLALWEGGLPYKLDPKTLLTDPEEYTMEGLLKAGEALTAHPRVDSKNNRLVAFSSKQESMKMANVRVFEWDSSLTKVAERTFAVPGSCRPHEALPHDSFLITHSS